MVNRAEQSWPEDETVEIPAEQEPETDQHDGTLIADLTNLVEQTEKGERK